MKTILSLVLAVFIAMLVTAQDSDTVPASASILTADTANLKDFLWLKRPLVIFADTPADPRYIEQMGYITERLDVLTALDVVVITDTDPDARSDLRKTLRPRGFGLVLIGKDGVIYLRLGMCARSSAPSTSCRCANRNCASAPAIADPRAPSPGPHRHDQKPGGGVHQHKRACLRLPCQHCARLSQHVMKRTLAQRAHAGARLKACASHSHPDRPVEVGHCHHGPIRGQPLSDPSRLTTRGEGARHL